MSQLQVQEVLPGLPAVPAVASVAVGAQALDDGRTGKDEVDTNG